MSIMKKYKDLILEKYSNPFKWSIWCRYKNYLLVFGYMNYSERSVFMRNPREYRVHRYNKLGWYYSFNKNFYNAYPPFPKDKKNQKELQRLDLKLFGKLGIRFF